MERFRARAGEQKRGAEGGGGYDEKVGNEGKEEEGGERAGQGERVKTSLPLLDRVVPDLERTRVLGGR